MAILFKSSIDSGSTFCQSIVIGIDNILQVYYNTMTSTVNIPAWSLQFLENVT